MVSVGGNALDIIDLNQTTQQNIDICEWIIFVQEMNVVFYLIFKASPVNKYTL